MLSHRELRATMSPLVFTGLRRRQSVQEKGHTDKCHLHHQLLQAGGRGGAPPGLHQRRVRAGRAGRGGSERASLALGASSSRFPGLLGVPIFSALCSAVRGVTGKVQPRPAVPGLGPQASGGLGNPRPALPAVQSLTARSCSWLVFLGGACSLQSCNPLWGGQSLYPARFGHVQPSAVQPSGSGPARAVLVPACVLGPGDLLLAGTPPLGVCCLASKRFPPREVWDWHPPGARERDRPGTGFHIKCLAHLFLSRAQWVRPNLRRQGSCGFPWEPLSPTGMPSVSP